MFSFRVLRPAVTPRELFRFRYKIYIEELGRKQTYVDHARKVIIDDLDDTARQVVAFRDGEVIACIRANLIKHGGVGYYESFYGLDRLPPRVRGRASICTRLSVHPDFRRHPQVTRRLFQTLYNYGVRDGVQYSYLDCYPRLIRFFEKFGYEHIGCKNHYDYGDAEIMRLDLLDFPRLIASGSVFAEQAAQFEAEKAAARAAASGGVSAPAPLGWSPAT